MRKIYDKLIGGHVAVVENELQYRNDSTNGEWLPIVDMGGEYDDVVDGMRICDHIENMAIRLDYTLSKSERLWLGIDN